MGGLMILAGITVSTLLSANLSNPYIWIVLGVTLAYGGREARPAAWALGASMVALAASLAVGYVRL